MSKGIYKPSYDDFVSAAQSAGLLGQFSKYDLETAKLNPEFGMSMLSYKKDYTSQDILHRISDDTDGTAAAELRELYIRARYDETHEVSQAQVEAAKAALKRSRGCTNASAR